MSFGLLFFFLYFCWRSLYMIYNMDAIYALQLCCWVIWAFFSGAFCSMIVISDHSYLCGLCCLDLVLPSLGLCLYSSSECYLIFPKHFIWKVLLASLQAAPVNVVVVLLNWTTNYMHYVSVSETFKSLITFLFEIKKEIKLSVFIYLQVIFHLSLELAISYMEAMFLLH